MGALTVFLLLGGSGKAGMAAEEKKNPFEALEIMQERMTEGTSVPGLIDGAAILELEETIPVKYDARAAGKQPAVKSQGSLGTCWAITVTSALEAALLPGEHLVFSADHMSLNNGFHITQNEGEIIIWPCLT